MWPPIPLPQPNDLFAIFLHTAGALAAYKRVISLEGADLLPIKILGWMLIYAPTPEGRANLVESIDHCGEDEKLVDLGKFYFNKFVNYCKHLVPA